MASVLWQHCFCVVAFSLCKAESIFLTECPGERERACATDSAVQARL